MIIKERMVEIINNPRPYIVPNKITRISLFEEIEEISMSDEEKIELFKSSMKVSKEVNQFIHSEPQLNGRFKAVVVLSQYSYTNNSSVILIYDLKLSEQVELELGITDNTHLDYLGFNTSGNNIESVELEILINNLSESWEEGVRLVEFSKEKIQLMLSVDLLSKAPVTNYLFQAEYIIKDSVLEIYYNQKMKKYFTIDGFNIVVTPKV